MTKRQSLQVVTIGQFRKALGQESDTSKLVIVALVSALLGAALGYTIAAPGRY